MSLERTRPRRTIILENLSFAAGSLELIHPDDVPYMMLIAFREEETAVNDYYVFCVEQGVITIDDLEFLVELTADETLEVWGILESLAGSDYQSPMITPKDELSPDEEAVAQKFSELLNGMFPGMNPPGDQPDTDAAAEIDRILGEEGDEPTC